MLNFEMYLMVHVAPLILTATHNHSICDLFIQYNDCFA